MADNKWEELATDFGSGIWARSVCLLPFLDAKLKRFAEERGGAPWRVLDVGCGVGEHTLMALRAGASYVLAFDVAENMVEGAKMATDKFLHSQAQPGSAKVDVVLASATNCSSIPGPQEATFDLALCVYVMCNLQSKEEIKQTLAEVCKMLKPGGKLFIYENHALQVMGWDDIPGTPFVKKLGWAAPKEDGTRWAYYEDEGKSRLFTLVANSGQEITFPTRNYTLSSWVEWIVEAGFQITELKEPFVDPKLVPGDAPEFARYFRGKPLGLCWVCTKPLS